MRPLGVGEILDVALRVFLRHAVTLLLAAAVVVVPVQLLLGPVFESATLDGSEDDAATLAAKAAAAMLGALGSLMANSVAIAACFKAVSDAYLGGRPDWRESLRFGARRFVPVLGVSLLAAVLAGVGLLAFVVPGVYLLVAWSVGVPVVLTERTGGFAALSRSRELVTGHWWPTFAALLLAYMLTAAVAVFLGGALVALIMALAPEGSLASQTLNQLFTALATVLTTPFFAAVVAVIYFDLRVRKGGFDPDLLAERAGTDPAAAPSHRRDHHADANLRPLDR